MGSAAHTPNSGFACDIAGSRATNTPRQTRHPPKRSPIQPKPSLLGSCRPMGLHFGGHTPSSRGLAPPLGGELHDTMARHAGDTPQEGFVSCKTPTATVVERTCGPGRPGPSAHEQQKPSNRTQGRPTSGTKLSQHTRPHRMSGTKLSQHTRPHRMCGTKLSPLTRNALIWRNLRMQGEFCTVLTTKKPSRENFVPNARQRSN